MVIGVGTVRLRLPGNRSLKGKRRVIASLCSRVRGRFNVAIAEVADNDSWQVATLGLACVANDARHADEALAKALAYVESGREDVEVLGVESEIVSGF